MMQDSAPSAKTIMAYTVSYPDNGADYYRDAPGEVYCPVCRCVADRAYVPKTLHLKACPYDLSSTYDFRTIASERMKNLCARLRIPGVDFIPVNDSPPLYAFRPRRVLALDLARMHVEFLGGACENCGQHKNVLGPWPTFLKDVEEPVNVGVYRSDVEFGWQAKEGEIIVGLETKEQIKRAGIRDLDYIPVGIENVKPWLTGR